MLFRKSKKPKLPPATLPANFTGWDNHRVLPLYADAWNDRANKEEINEHLKSGFPCYIWFGQFEIDRDQIIAASLNDSGRLIVKLPPGYWVEPGPGTRIELC